MQAEPLRKFLISRRAIAGVEVRPVNVRDAAKIERAITSRDCSLPPSPSPAPYASATFPTAEGLTGTGCTAEHADAPRLSLATYAARAPGAAG